MRLGHFLLLAASAAALAQAAMAGETTTYTYDALGRLTGTSTAGTVNDGAATAVGYDSAGNRTGYTVGGAGGGAPAPIPPTPPANRPPTALDDAGAQPKCTTRSYDVLANDSDPDGDALTLESVSGSGFSVAAGRVQVVSTISIGEKSGTYVVRDSRGAAAEAVLRASVAGGTCNPQPPGPGPQPAAPAGQDGPE